MKKYMIPTVILVLVIALCVSVGAMQSSVASPRLKLSADGATATCEATITSLGNKIDATLVLKQEDEVLASWTETGTSVLSFRNECDIAADAIYTLELTGNAGDIPFSITKACKAEPPYEDWERNYISDAKKFSKSKIKTMDVYPVDIPRLGIDIEMLCVEYENGDVLLAEYDETGMTCSIYRNEKKQLSFFKYYEKGKIVESYERPMGEGW